MLSLRFYLGIPTCMFSRHLCSSALVSSQIKIFMAHLHQLLQTFSLAFAVDRLLLGKMSSGRVLFFATIPAQDGLPVLYGGISAYSDASSSNDELNSCSACLTRTTLTQIFVRLTATPHIPQKTIETARRLDHTVIDKRFQEFSFGLKQKPTEIYIYIYIYISLP